MLLYIVRHGETDWNKAGKDNDKNNENRRYDVWTL